MMSWTRDRVIHLLRWSERYTKTDMVYLAQVGIWSNLSVITSSVLALLLSVIFANFLSKELYGIYQYLLSIAALVTATCLTGMQHAVAQSVARGNEGDLKISLRAQLKWNILPIIISSIGAGYYAFNGNNVLALGLCIIAIASPLISAFNVYAAFLTGTGQFKRYFIYGFIINLVYFAAIATAILFFKNAVVLIFVNLGINAIMTIFFYFRTLKVSHINGRTDSQTVPYGMHLSIMNAFSTVISQLDSILVFHFLGPVNLAVYSFATFIPERAGALLSFIGTAAFPKFSKRSLGEIQKSIIPQTIRAGLLGICMMVVYIFLSPLLFHILFPEYKDALLYTQFYAPIIFLMAANLVSMALAAQRLKRELYIMSFVNPILLITLQIPLLLLFGIWGMLAARLLNDLIGILLGIVLLIRKKPEVNDTEN